MRTFRSIAAFALGLITVGAILTDGCAQTPPQTGPTLRHGKLVIAQDKARATLDVEIADTPDARQLGLGNRTALEENAGMLFMFEETLQLAFWMKDTLIPLSVAFIDEQWKIVDIKDMPVAPDPKIGPFDIYRSAKPARYALEVNLGFFPRHNLGVGAKVIPGFKIQLPIQPAAPPKYP